MKRTVFVIVAVLLSTASAQMTWTCATESAAWAPRADHASVVFDNKMWILGGAETWGPPEVLKNDVWCSANGVDWTRVEDSAPWSPRCPEAVVFDSKIWVIGGWRDLAGGGLNDVWYSTDGDSWVCATASAGWTTRGGHGVAIFNGKMWVVGGYDAHTRNDVYWSTDGANWTEAVHSAPWSGRYYPGVVEFDSMLWVMGGLQSGCFNDVWYSVDGTNWTQATGSADWSKRAAYGAVVFDGKMWVMGGMSDPPWDNRLGDVWYSVDGTSWSCADSSAEWARRGWPGCYVCDNKIWVTGGDSTVTSLIVCDVWSSTGLGVEESHQPQASSSKLWATILAGAGVQRLASCDIFDAMGRRTANPKPGVYFVREEPQAADHKPQAVRKVVVTR